MNPNRPQDSRVLEELPSFDDLRAAVTLPPDVIAAYWSGSVVAGWTHAMSDLDGYVICKSVPAVRAEVVELVPADPPEVFVLVGTIGDRRLDAELWSESQVDQIVERVGSWRSPEGNSHAPTLAERDFLFRLTIGYPICGKDWLEDRRRELQRHGFAGLLAAHAVGEADSLLEDVAGLVRSGDLPSAVLAARSAFHAVVDALAIQEGQLSPSAKWRARRVAAAAPPSLSWDRYWSTETMRNFDPGDPEKWIRETVALCQDLIMEVEMPD